MMQAEVTARLARVLDRMTGPVAWAARAASDNAFHRWRSQRLVAPSGGAFVDFAGLVPPGKRAVIELVTAILDVPEGDSASLRMYTSRGSVASTTDLAMSRRGRAGGRDVLVATHHLRTSSDCVLQFSVTREGAGAGSGAGSSDSGGEGDAFLCVSGYFVDG